MPKPLYNSHSEVSCAMFRGNARYRRGTHREKLASASSHVILFFLMFKGEALARFTSLTESQQRLIRIYVKAFSLYPLTDLRIKVEKTTRANSIKTRGNGASGSQDEQKIQWKNRVPLGNVSRSNADRTLARHGGREEAMMKENLDLSGWEASSKSVH